MEKIELDENNSFKVTESKTVNYIASAAFFLMFATAVFSGNIDFANHLRMSIALTGLLLLPAIAFLKKATSKNIIIEINSSGIYYYGQIITSWENYMSSKVTQDEVVRSLSDNFVLLIEYFRPEAGMSYICKLPLTNTQSKSEEEIIAAINYFVDQSATAAV